MANVSSFGNGKEILKYDSKNLSTLGPKILAYLNELRIKLSYFEW